MSSVGSADNVKFNLGLISRPKGRGFDRNHNKPNKMKNKKGIIIGIIVAVIVIITLIAVFWPKTTAGQTTVLYFSNACTHCQTVEKFIQDNNITSKVTFEQKEISQNSGNTQELIAKAVKCGINQANVGVPLLTTNGQCIVGEQDIINYFKTQAGIK